MNLNRAQEQLLGEAQSPTHQVRETAQYSLVIELIVCSSGSEFLLKDDNVIDENLSTTKKMECMKIYTCSSSKII